MQDIKLGYAICGSFCTIQESLKEVEKLVSDGFSVTPILSEIASTADTRFTKADELSATLTELCGRPPITSIVEAEPIGPKKMFDILAVCPCTGNTLAKLANGITDSTVTMAVKAHLRNNRPVVLAIATNDALGGSARNIGALLNTKNIFFVPFGQDDPIKKEKSLIADFSRLKETIFLALEGRQTAPLLI